MIQSSEPRGQYHTHRGDRRKMNKKSCGAATHTTSNTRRHTHCTTIVPHEKLLEQAALRKTRGTQLVDQTEEDAYGGRSRADITTGDDRVTSGERRGRRNDPGREPPENT